MGIFSTKVTKNTREKALFFVFFVDVFIPLLASHQPNDQLLGIGIPFVVNGKCEI